MVLVICVSSSLFPMFKCFDGIWCTQQLCCRLGMSCDFLNDLTAELVYSISLVRVITHEPAPKQFALIF